MNHTIICIGRQYGSGGREIGEKLAKHLNITCYDKLLIKQAAKEAGLSEETVEADDEQPIGLATMVSGNTFADSITLGETFYSEKEHVFDAERNVILEIAAKGPCVIIGRCAPAILREKGYDVLSVFAYAEKDDRANRIAQRNGIGTREAMHKAERVDRLRKRYFDFYAGTPWGEPESYDLMISSSYYGIDGAAAVLAAAFAAKEAEEPVK